MAKKTAKKPAKKPATKRAKPATKGAARSSSPVSLFFDEVDKNPSLQQRIAMQNTKILEVAKAAGFLFTYEDMAAHLRVRWCIECGPKEDYCCF